MKTINRLAAFAAAAAMLALLLYFDTGPWEGTP